MKIKDFFSHKRVAMAPEGPSNIHSVSDEKTIATDLDLETPYWGYSPSDYRFSTEFSDLENTVKRMATDLFNELSDEQIGDSIERYLANLLKKELLDLSHQRINHQEVIHNLSLRRVSLKEGYNKKLAELEEEHQQLYSECSKIIFESKKSKWEDSHYDE